MNMILVAALLAARARAGDDRCEPEEAAGWPEACRSRSAPSGVALLQLRGPVVVPVESPASREALGGAPVGPEGAPPARAPRSRLASLLAKPGKQKKKSKKAGKKNKGGKTDKKCLADEKKKCKKAGSPKKQKTCLKDAKKKCKSGKGKDESPPAAPPKLQSSGVGPLQRSAPPAGSAGGAVATVRNSQAKTFPACLWDADCTFGDGPGPVKATKTKASAFFGENDQWFGEAAGAGPPPPKKELLSIAQRLGRGAVASIGDVDGDGIPDVAWGDAEKVSKWDSAGFFSEIPPPCAKNAKGEECHHIESIEFSGVYNDVKQDQYNPTLTDGSVYIGLMKADGSFKGYKHITLADPVLEAAGAEHGPYTGKPLDGDKDIAAKSLMTAAFGAEVVGIGDWDGDGTPDIAVLATGFDTVRCCEANQGFPGGMGTNLGTGENLGCTKTADGCGAQKAIEEGTERLMPFIYRILLRPDGSAKAATKLALPSPPQGYDYDVPDDYLLATQVTSLSVVGDVNGDGFMDIAIGTPADSAVCYMCGAIYVGLMTEEDVDWVRTDARMTNGRPVPGIGTGKCASGDKQEKKRPYNQRVVAKGDFKKHACVDGLDDDDCFDFGGYVCAGGGPDASGKLHFDLMGFGDRVVGLGDVDGDGTPDLAVTSKWLHEGAKDSCGAQGMVWILFLHAEGSVISAHRTLGPKKGVPAKPIGCGNEKGSPNDFPIGWTVAAAGDLTGDGVPDLLFGFEDQPDESEFAGGDFEGAGWARGGMIVLAPVARSGAVGRDPDVASGEVKDCGERPAPGSFSELFYLRCEMDNKEALAPPHMSLPLPWQKLDDLGYDDSCPLFYAKQDAAHSTPLKHNREGCAKYPCNGYAVAETLDGYPGTCGSTGTRTGGAQFGAAIAALGDLDGDGRLDLLVGAPGEKGGHSANFPAGSFRVLRGITRTALNLI